MTIVQTSLWPALTPITKPKPTVTPERDAERDLLWDCLTTHIGPAVTKSERGIRGRVITELVEIGATPQDVAARCRNYRAEWPTVTLSDAALIKHWSKFDPARRQVQPVAPLRGGTRILLNIAQRRQTA